MSAFFQKGPELGNTYAVNPWLKKYLSWKVKSHFAEFDPALQQLGEKCRSEYLQLAREAEKNTPEHIPFDAWGNRIDEIKISHAWTELQKIAAREGLIAIGYERHFAEWSRVFQFAKLYLFHPSSAFFTCPLAMADGAARVIEVYGQEDPKLAQAFRHLTSRDPAEFWTSGQWMTEKTGGSDVSGTSTIVKLENGQCRLYGTKWFSSSTLSEMALALGRYEDSPAGGKGLSLFYVETHQTRGRLNNIKVLRLKDKLGTKALPTAELELEGAAALPVGEKHHGVKTVATMLNITRLYNSICSCGQMARALDLLRDYSKSRVVFDRPLSAQPLHQVTFSQAELLHLTSFLFTMNMVELMGREETSRASESERDILRLMTPVCKLFTGKNAIQVASEVIEGFGGAGYVEDTGIAVHLRDAQVFPIWEGATNVLSLDVLRVLQKGPALESLFKKMSGALQDLSSNSKMAEMVSIYSQAISSASGKVQKLMSEKPEVVQANMRSFSFYLGRLYSGVLLLEWAAADAQMIPWAQVWTKHNLGSWDVLSSQDVGEIEAAMRF